MFKDLLRKAAWVILEDHIRENYIHREYLKEYTEEMSESFPVMTDTCIYFKDKPFGQCERLKLHRWKMHSKYIKGKELTNLPKL
jgi:hypothetical protein